MVLWCDGGVGRWRVCGEERYGLIPRIGAAPSLITEPNESLIWKESLTAPPAALGPLAAGSKPGKAIAIWTCGCGCGWGWGGAGAGRGNIVP